MIILLKRMAFVFNEVDLLIGLFYYILIKEGIISAVCFHGE
ncbi:hypothetical protein BBU72A_0126 [Borreliella burgdorferi 72a]|nr:hypothetical protein BBU72A_0126 [Borreliella burgdorferi 72a]